MAMLERAIGAAFVNNGLHIHHLGGVQGPHTFTFAMRLYQPTAANLTKAKRLGPAIEASIGDSPARVYTEQGLVWVEVPSPWPSNVPGSTLRGKGLAVPLGLTSRKAIAGWDAERDPHLLIVGPTGRGKTTAARAVAFHLARQTQPRTVQFVAITFKPDDWRAFGNLAHTTAVIISPAEAANALEWMRNAMHRRTREGTARPHVFLFVDDLLNLLAVTDVTTPLAEIASLGRAAGFHLVIGTQRLGKRGAGDAAITGNMPVRLVFGTADAQDAAFFTGRGQSGAENLGRYKGDALLVTDGGTVRLAVSPVADSDLATLPQDPSQARPWGTVRTVPTARGVIQPRNPQTPPVKAGSSGSNGSENRSGGYVEPPPELARTASEPAETPLLDGEPTTPQERAKIRAIYAQTGSKSATCRIVWGHKNGETWAWLNQALAETEEAKGGHRDPLP
jgi:DNA polymerase III delta prime subunit